MSYSADFEQMMVDTVTVTSQSTAATARNAYGVVTYSTSTTTTYKAYIERRQRRVTTKDGRDVVSGTTVYLGRSTTDPSVTAASVDESAKVSVHGFTRILSIEQFNDEDGFHHTALHLG